MKLSAPSIRYGTRCQSLAMRSLPAIFAASTLAIGSLVSLSAQAQPSPAMTTVTLSPNFSPSPIELRGLSGGSTPLQSLAGQADTPTGPCSGFADTEPDHTIVLKGFFDYLSLQVQSPQDTTLMIKGPGGAWCNDDYEGKNPGIAGQWLAGTYQVWIGSYDKTKYIPYILKLSRTR